MTDTDAYPVLIRRTPNGFVAEAPALGLSRTGPDVQALEAGMRAAIGEILMVCERHGARITAAPEKDAVIPQDRSYRRTIAQVMIVLLAIVILTMPLMWGFQKMTGVMTASLEKINATRVEGVLSSGLQKAADALETITPERRTQLARDFGRVARALEPYAVELRPLLAAASSARDIAPGDRRP